MTAANVTFCLNCEQPHRDKTKFCCQRCSAILCTAQVTTFGPFPYAHRGGERIAFCGPVWEIEDDD